MCCAAAAAATSVSNVLAWLFTETCKLPWSCAASQTFSKGGVAVKAGVLPFQTVCHCSQGTPSRTTKRVLMLQVASAVFCRTCEAEGCGTVAVNNYPGEKGGRFCAKHRLYGMVRSCLWVLC